MPINPAANNGLLSIQRGMQGLERNAQAIASRPVTGGDEPGRDLAAPLVESRVNLRQVQAGAAVIRTEDEMIGSLLDTFA